MSDLQNELDASGDEQPESMNKFVRYQGNPGGIQSTLERWFANPNMHKKWLLFDGVTVAAFDRIDHAPTGYRSICLIGEIGRYLSPIDVDNPYGVDDLLWHPEVWPER